MKKIILILIILGFTGCGKGLIGTPKNTPVTEQGDFIEVVDDLFVYRFVGPGIALLDFVDINGVVVKQCPESNIQFGQCE